jgi:hypothetical protein
MQDWSVISSTILIHLSDGNLLWDMRYKYDAPDGA